MPELTAMTEPAVPKRRDTMVTMPQWLLALIFVCGSGAVLLPALYFEFPLSVDYLNHLSRLYVMFTSDPWLAQMFTVRLEAIPNLGLDAAAFAGHALGIGNAMLLKGFFIGSALVLSGGILACHAAVHGRVRNSIVLALPIQYGFLMTYGVMDFMAGTGVALFVLAWIIRANPRVGLRSIVVMNICATIIFFCHFGAFLVLALSVFLYRIGLLSRITKKDIALLAIRSAVESLVPAAFYLLAYHAKIDGFSWSEISYKLLMVASSFEVGDLPFGEFFAVVAAAFMVSAIRVRAVGFDRKWRPLVLGFAIAAFIAPFGYQASYFIDTRLAWFALLIAAVTIDVRLTRAWVEPFMIGLAIAMVAIDAQIITAETSLYNAQIVEFRKAIDVIPQHSFVFVSSYEGCKAPVDSRFFQFAPALVTIDRQAMHSTMFGTHGQVANILKPQYFDYVSPYPQPPVDSAVAALMAEKPGVPLEFEQGRLVAARIGVFPFMVGWEHRFPYAIHLAEGCKVISPYDAMFPRVAKGSFFTIYKTGAP